MRAIPGRPAGQARESGGGWWVGQPCVGEDRLDLADRDGPEPEPDAAGSDGRQELILLVGAQDDRHPGGRLLEGLEERRLGVLVQAVRLFDQRDTCATLDGQQGEVRDQPPDGPGLGFVARPDPDLVARTRRNEPMEIGVAAVLDEAAATALPARPIRRVRRIAQQPGGEVEGERRLADPGGAGDDDRVRRRSGDHRPDRGRGRVMTAGQEARHRDGQAVSAFLRVVRRLGAAPASAASAPAAASLAAESPAVSAAPTAGALARVVLRFGAALAPAASPAAAEESALRRGALRFGASAVASGDAAPSDAATAVDSVDSVFRLVVRRFVAGSAPADASDGALDGAASLPVASRRLAGRRRLGRLGELSPEDRLQLLGNLAPRLARPRAGRSVPPVLPVEAVLPRRSILPDRSRPARSAARSPAGGLPGADVGIAVDAATAASAVPLTVDRGVVSGAATARPAATLLAPATATAALAAALLGDQVFRDLRLVEVLVVGRGPDRGRLRARHAELRVPDGPERRGAWGAGRRRDLDFVFLFVGLAVRCIGQRLRSDGAGSRLEAGLQLATATPTPTPTASPPAPAAAVGIQARVVLGIERCGGEPSAIGTSAWPVTGATLESFSPGSAVKPGAGGDVVGTVRGRPSARGDRLGLAWATASASPSAAPATRPGALGLLVGHLGHREVFVVAGDPPAGPRRALLDASELGDVGEDVGYLDEVRRRVATEADDLDSDAHLLDRPDRRGEVPVARHDDRHVEVASRLHQVDDELDVEIGLDLAVAVLANVLADDLVLVPGQEGMKVALVLVVRVKPGIGIGADEVPACRGRLQQRDVIDIHAGRLGRVEDVRHVHEDGDVLSHK